MTAHSFRTTAAIADDLVPAFTEATEAINKAAGGLVFVSGTLTQQTARIAEHLRTLWRGVPVCVVPGAGVLSERGELERVNAASGLLWQGGETTAVTLPHPREMASQQAAELIAQASNGRRASAFLFAQPDAFSSDLLSALAHAAPRVHVLGGGTVGAPPLCIDGSGTIRESPTSALVLTGLAPPVSGSSAACKLLSSFEPIDECEGGFVLSIAGRPALERLSEVSRSLGSAQEQAPLLFVALADTSSETLEDRHYVIRPIRGVDPSQQSILIGRDVHPGVQLAFGARDAKAAREGLLRMANTVFQAALGSAPRFAVYITCAGRGQGLYGSPDVETRILKQRFSDLPIAGMHSSFELVPQGPGKTDLAFYTGVFSLFRSPS